MFQIIPEDQFSFAPEDPVQPGVFPEQILCAAAQTFRTAHCDPAGGIEFVISPEQIHCGPAVEQIKIRQKQVAATGVYGADRAHDIFFYGHIIPEPFPMWHIPAGVMEQGQRQGCVGK